MRGSMHGTRLLIDTHALLWFCDGNPVLSPQARAAMEDDLNGRFVSHASAWEVDGEISNRRHNINPSGVP